MLCIAALLIAGFLLTGRAAVKEPIPAAGKSLQGLNYTHSMELSYAEQFAVDYYEGGYELITIADSGSFLLVPEGKAAPENIGEDIVVLSKPLKNIYLVATSAMDFFCALNRLDAVRLSGTDANGWYLEEAKEALNDGSILFAGKYSAPDYERIVTENCGLALESTMIYHTPEVKETLEKFGIPVMVERSSYEKHPLGRTEWIKLYGALLDRNEEAEQIFKEQEERMQSVLSEESTGKSVAFFYITTNGYANVRKSGDYIANMIDLAGGKYVFENLANDENALSTVNMQMEEFYAGAKDADYLIYNSTIDGELENMEQFLEKSSLLKDFKAVKEGNVWCVEKKLFQQATGLGVMTEDMHKMLTDEDGTLTELTYMHRLK